MGHPVIDNLTPFAFEPAFLSDEENRPLFVPIVKATFRILDGGRLERAVRQVPVNFAGSFYGPPALSSYRREPEGVFFKPGTDCVLIGHAHAPGGQATQMDVGFRVGPAHKLMRVTGDRLWYKSLGSIAMTPPAPFEKMPLQYERAFGGGYRSGPNDLQPELDFRNPVGRGFRASWHVDEETVPVANLEDPDNLVRRFDDRPVPMGFGFTSPHWVPRSALGGTYDAAWIQNRQPRLPLDFQRAYFNGGSPGLVVPGRLRGDEPVTVIGASPQGRIDFNLPGIAPPFVQVTLRRSRQAHTLRTELDTVIVDMDESTLTLLWRTHLPVRDVPNDIVSMVVRGVPTPAAMVVNP